MLDADRISALATLARAMASIAQPRMRTHPGAHGLAYQARVLRVVAATEFKLKYADSVLGYVWSLIKPLALFSVLYVVFGRFFKLDLGFEHYPLYLLVGIVLWTFFADATTLAMPSIVARSSLLRKLSFPRLIIPVSATLTAGLTFVVNLLAIVGFVAWNRLVPRVEWLLLLPLLAELYLFVLAFSVILATLFVRFRDIGQIWELGAQLLFYASPIIYPVDFLPLWVQRIAFLNPFVQIMQDARQVLLFGEEPAGVPTAANVYATSAGRLLPIGILLLALALALWLFRRESPWFAERV